MNTSSHIIRSRDTTLYESFRGFVDTELSVHSLEIPKALIQQEHDLLDTYGSQVVRFSSGSSCKTFSTDAKLLSTLSRSCSASSRIWCREVPFAYFRSRSTRRIGFLIDDKCWLESTRRKLQSKSTNCGSSIVNMKTGSSFPLPLRPIHDTALGPERLGEKVREWYLYFRVGSKKKLGT